MPLTPREMDYKAEEYWEGRLKANFSLSATGHSGFSLRYNRYMYKLKAKKLAQALARHNINVKGARVLDIGCGTGFFVEYYLNKGARAVVGIDITDVSVNLLSEKFSGQRFYRLDISKGRCSGADKFDIINVFDVLYHIVDDGDFKSAIKNMAISARPGTWMFITDSLRPELGGAQHVRYRGLDNYRDILTEEGIDIVEVTAVLNLLGRPPVYYFHDTILEKILARLTELSRFFAYLADSLYCPFDSAIMKLLICRKR